MLNRFYSASNTTVLLNIDLIGDYGVQLGTALLHVLPRQSVIVEPRSLRLFAGTRPARTLATKQNKIGVCLICPFLLSILVESNDFFVNKSNKASATG